jgi:ATP/maltotriose-dependent transcriptional regulator MalT
VTTLNEEIKKHIKKLMFPLKEPEELLEVLKVKLTKKELKLLRSWAEGSSAEEIQKNLQLDEERYGELSTKLIKKLNQEKIKQAMCI